MQPHDEAGEVTGQGCELAGFCSGELDRRGFLTKSTLAAVALALAACASGDATGPDISGASIRVSDYPSLANVNGVATFTLNRQPLAVVRTSATTFLALSRVCPHQGGTIGVFGSGFMCPVHGAQFSLSGQWVGGQRTSNMQSYQTSYNATTDTLTIS